jgi:hypothetical protein
VRNEKNELALCGGLYRIRYLFIFLLGFIKESNKIVKVSVGRGPLPRLPEEQQGMHSPLFDTNSMFQVYTFLVFIVL